MGLAETCFEKVFLQVVVGHCHLIEYLTKPVGFIRNSQNPMNFSQLHPDSQAHQEWSWSVSPRQARRGLTVIVGLVAVLGLLSLAFGTSSDSSSSSPSYEVSH